jgi:hypothetical protein
MSIEIKFVGVPQHFAWQNTEFIVAAMIKGLREMTGRDVRPTQVGFTMAHDPDSGEFERFFGCPVSSAVRRINSVFRMRRSQLLFSPKINTSLRRFNPFATRRRRSATRLMGRRELPSRTKCRNCCRTAKPTGRGSRRRWGCRSERSRKSLARKIQATTRSSTACGTAWRSNISRSPSFRSPKLLGWAMKDRAPSIMLSRVGRGGRRQRPAATMKRSTEDKVSKLSRVPRARVSE